MSETKETYRINMLCLQLAAILQRILNGETVHTEEEKESDHD